MLKFSDPLSACTGSCLAATFTAYYSERAAGTGSYKIDDADIVTHSTGYSWTSQGEDPNGAGCSNEIYVEVAIPGGRSETVIENYVVDLEKGTSKRVRFDGHLSVSAPWSTTSTSACLRARSMASSGQTARARRRQSACCAGC